MANKKDEVVEKTKTTKKKKTVEKEKMSIIPTLIIILAQVAACMLYLMQIKMLLFDSTIIKEIDSLSGLPLKGIFEPHVIIMINFVATNAIMLLSMYWAYYKGKTRILEILESLIIIYYLLLIPGGNITNTIITIVVGITPLVMGLYYRIKLIKES